MEDKCGQEGEKQPGLKCSSYWIAGEPRICFLLVEALRRRWLRIQLAIRRGLLDDPFHQGGPPEVGWDGEVFIFCSPPGSQERVSKVRHLSELDLCPLLLGDMLDG